MPHVAVSTGIETFYERTGSGPPLLLIMGTGLDHSCWDAQVQVYRHYYDCICFDNRGTGRTKAPEGSLTTDLLARDAIGLLDSLGIDKAHVSGLSLGSCIAQELVLARPDRVRTLQLHGTWGRAHGYAARKFKAQIRLLEMLDLKSFYEINILWFLTPEFMHRHPDRVRAKIASIVAATPSKRGPIAQYRADLEHDALDRLRQIQVPTLVTVGTFDVAVPPFYAEEVARAIPEAELVCFPGGGHLHNMEHPEDFNRATLAFLQRHSGDP